MGELRIIENFDTQIPHPSAMVVKVSVKSMVKLLTTQLRVVRMGAASGPAQSQGHFKLDEVPALRHRLIIFRRQRVCFAFCAVQPRIPQGRCK